MLVFFFLDEIQKFLEYVASLEYKQEPDYEYIKKLFRAGLRKSGVTDDGRSVRFIGGKQVDLSSQQLNGDTNNDEETQNSDKKVGRATAKIKKSPQKVSCHLAVRAKSFTSQMAYRNGAYLRFL